MKKFYLISIFVLLAGALNAQQLTLDETVKRAARGIEEVLPQRALVAVLNFASPSEAFSDYVIEELTGELVMGRKVTIVDRRSLALISQEMNLQLSGDVSDESAQAIGKLLGAQSIVSGSLTNMGIYHRFRIRVINVETAAIQTQVSLDLQNSSQVAFLLSGTAAAASGGSLSGQAPAPVSTSTTYNLGDRGPAGGIVFYDKGNDSGGWRYLEAAPADLTKIQWQSSSTDVSGTKDTIGSGKENTQMTIRYNVRPAMLCQQYSLGGYQDWFLPSKAELDLMYMNLKVIRDMGNFSSDWYWSSTQASYSTYAWAHRFSDGNQDYRDKSNSYSVRPIRQF